MVLADLDPLGEQVSLDSRRDPVPLRVRDQLDPNAPAGCVAQQGKAGQGERIVAEDEGRGQHLLARIEDHLYPRLRRLAVGLEDADLVGEGGGGQEAEDEPSPDSP